MRPYSPIITSARSALFVPGVRPERFQKARTSGADLAILDLEDSVLDSEKSLALENVLAEVMANDQEGCPFVVRVNSDRLLIELPELLEASARNNSFVGIVLPKAEHSAAIPNLPDHLSFIAIVESALGVQNVQEIAHHESVAKLAFGGMDFAAEMASHSPVVHDYARVQILMASIVAGKSRPWDSPSAHIQDVSAVLSEAKHARDLGFGGKLAIHPAQLPAVHDAFAVTEQEIAWARSVLESEAGASQINGQMVDKPILLQAQGILRRAGLTS
ncbi:MAG: CoA ester lyase [Aquiluna sp.]|nr:CoA ester lyase [Aquiluna sp.]